MGLTKTEPAEAVEDPSVDFIEVPWALTPEHRAWRQTIRRFCQKEVAPSAGARSAAERFDPGLVTSLADLGVFTLALPAPLGAGDLRSLCIAIEEMAAVDSSLAVTVHVQAMNVAMFELFTRDRPDLREPLLSDAIRG